jgi:hypothetical protein
VLHFILLSVLVINVASASFATFRTSGWTTEMHNFYNDPDPEMADITLDGLIQKLPADADWYKLRLAFFYYN